MSRSRVRDSSDAEDADGNGVTASVVLGGQKVGYGTAYLNNQSISTLGTLTYTRVDPFPQEVYANIWVTNGTNYALLTPRDVQTGGGYFSSTVNGLNMQNFGFGVYGTDVNNLNWLYSGAQRTGSGDVLKADGTALKISDLSNLLMITGSYGPQAGGGDPKAGYGFNIVFGDTLANHAAAYQIDNVTLNGASPAVVPLPAALPAGLALFGMIAMKRRMGRPTKAE